MNKRCVHCKQEKNISDFCKNAGMKNGLSKLCRMCKKDSDRKYYLNNRVSIQLKQKEPNRIRYLLGKEKILGVCKRYREGLRKNIIDGYGAVCNCCGETERAFLTLDHVLGNGAEHRREKSVQQIYREVINSNFPEQYRLLCMNCNFANRFGKRCPHENFSPFKINKGNK